MTTGNRAFVRAVDRLNKQAKKRQGSPKLKLADAAKIYDKYQGKCVVCGLNLNVREITGINALTFSYYIPLEFGGSPGIENVVQTCLPHAKNYRATRTLREDIVDLNTIADVIERLITAVREGDRETARRLKVMLNIKFEDMALSMRYKVHPNQIPEGFQVLEEEVNTIPDQIEELVEATEEEVPAKKEEITDNLKQIVATKQYKIIRKRS